MEQFEHPIIAALQSTGFTHGTCYRCGEVMNDDVRYCRECREEIARYLFVISDMTKQHGSDGAEFLREVLT